MSKPKRELNPQLNQGDRVMCLHMDGETSVPPGTFGVVRSVARDPFEEEGHYIYSVDWDNGRTLGLLSNIAMPMKKAKPMAVPAKVE